MTEQAALLTGRHRDDTLIELTGLWRQFSEAARRTRVRFRTIPYPADTAEPETQVAMPFVSWMLTKRPGRRFALITPEAFRAAGLEPFVAMQNDPAPQMPPDAARAVGETLTALLIDRRDRLRIEQMPDEIKARLGADIDAHTVRDALSGKQAPRSRTLNALLLALHAQKPLTPGHLGALTGQLGRELDPTLRHLLHLPHWRFKEAYRDGQIQIAHNGEVTLAGLTVPPETAVVVLDEKRWPRQREGNQGRGNQGLSYFARSRKRDGGQGYGGRD